MATKTLTKSWSTSKFTTGVETNILATEIATFVAANIPPYSTINSVKVQCRAKQNLSTSQGDFIVTYRSSSSTTGTDIYRKDNAITNTMTTHTSDDVKSYFKSGTSDAGVMSSGYAIKVWLVATVIRTFTTENVAIIWDYTPPTHKVTLDANGGTVSPTYVNITGGNTYGSLPTPTRTGYTFNYWTLNGTRVYSTTEVNSSHTLVANWTVNTYTISASGTNGNVTGGGTYEYGSSVTLTATPNTGYKFVKWSDGNTSATRTVTVTANATYTAIFETNKISKILADTSFPSGIIIDKQEVKEVYIDKTKVWG